MPKNIPITVDKLRDVIESQRCLYGDAPVVVRPEPANPFFIKAANHYILDCQRDVDMAEDGITLKTLSEALKGLPGHARVMSEDRIRNNTEIGFYSPEEGFVATLMANEIGRKRIQAA